MHLQNVNSVYKCLYGKDFTAVIFVGKIQYTSPEQTISKGKIKVKFVYIFNEIAKWVLNIYHSQTSRCSF